MTQWEWASGGRIRNGRILAPKPRVQTSPLMLVRRKIECASGNYKARYRLLWQGSPLIFKFTREFAAIDALHVEAE